MVIELAFLYTCMNLHALVLTHRSHNQSHQKSGQAPRVRADDLRRPRYRTLLGELIRKMPVSDAIRSACINEFWDAMRDLVSLCLPDRETSLHAQFSAARLTSANSSVPETLASQLDEPCTQFVSYGKAFARLTGRPIALGDIIVYRDFDAFIHALGAVKGNDEYADLTLSSILKPEDVRVAEESMDTFWETTTKIYTSSRVLGDKSPELPKIPSSEDIASEIKRHKAAKKAPPAGTSSAGLDDARLDSINAALAELCRGYKKEPVVITADILAEIDTELGTVHEKSGKTFADAASEGDIEVISSAPFVERLSLPSPSLAECPMWKAFSAVISRAHGLSQMKKSMPPTMMKLIEQRASKLAASMQNGGGSPTDIMQIGQEVLQSCSQDDLSNLASNLPALVPNLKNVYEGMESDAKHAMPEGIKEMISAIDGAASMARGTGGA